MNIKMFLAYALSGVIFLSGCGTRQTQSGESAKKEVVWYFPMVVTQGQNEVFAKANEIIGEKLNLTVKFTPIEWAAYEDKIRMVLSTGENCDLLWASNWSNNFQQNIARGALYDITELVDKHAPKTKELIPDAIWQAVTSKNRVYGIPNYQISTYWHFMEAPKHFVDKYNFDPASFKKLEDLEPYLATLKANEPGVIPIDGTTAIFAIIREFEEISRDNPAVIWKDGRNHEVLNLYKTPEFKERLKLIRSWYEKGYIQSDVLQIKENESDYRARRIGASGSTTMAYPGSVNDYNKTVRGYEVYEIVVDDSPFLCTASASATITCVAQSSKNAKEAVQVAELVNNDAKLSNLLFFGIEGKHYKKVGENIIEVMENSDYKDVQGWVFGNTFNSFVKTTEDPQKHQKILETHEKAQVSSIMGFVFDGENVKNELSQLRAVRQELYIPLVKGAVDPDEKLPELIEKADRAGAQKVIDEVQRQINEFLAQKQ